MKFHSHLYSFDVAAWVKNNPSESEKRKAAEAGGGLKVAGSDPNKKEDDGIGIMMSMDKDESTRRQERDAEAEVKRQQNALPAWHLKSTITGDLTALGVKESARAEASNAASSSNDDILRGLGVVGGRPDQVVAMTVEDVKPAVSQESDCEHHHHTVCSAIAADFILDYDQYYASLAASSAASTQATPSGLSAPGSSDFGDVYDEEDDRKPNVEYLDSLNDYRKRSRSREDEGPTKTKVAKVSDTSVYGFGMDTGKLNGYTPDGGIQVEENAVMVVDVQSPPEDDPIVYGELYIQA